MKRLLFICSLCLTLAISIAPEALAQDGEDNSGTVVETIKRAQTGMKFLSLSVDPRAAAMGSALTAEMQGNSNSLFYNPASMAQMQGNGSASFANTGFISDIQYNVASAAFRPANGNYGVVGVSLQMVNYGDFQGTIRSTDDAGYTSTGDYSPTAMAIGVGYARSFTDKFSAGAHVKYALQDLGTFQVDPTSAADPNQDFSVNTIAFDFGVVYETGFKSLAIAFVARNFSQELTYVRENFELPLTLQFGASMNMLDFTSMDPNMHALRLNVDVQRPRDFDEHVRFGAEYKFMDMIALRGGFEQLGLDEEQGISLGAGVNFGLDNLSAAANYSYTDFGIFGAVNRIGLNIGF